MTDSPPSPRSELVRPDALLDGIGADAFSAFNAMQTTKQRHYALLARLEEKRSRYGLSPSERESTLLKALLADHDAQVRRFTAAAARLKQQDAEAHRELFGYVGVLMDVPVDGDDDAVRH